MMRPILPLFLLLCLLCFGQVQAHQWPWARSSYAHFAENEPIKELLLHFGSSVDIPVVVSDRVFGVVNGNFEEASALDFINRLSKMFNLVWYFDGQLLYVYDLSEVETKLIHLQGISSKRLVSSLKSLNLVDRRHQVETVDAEGIVKVSGPPRFTELVGEVADILMSAQQAEAEAAGTQAEVDDDFVVQVFELKHAWADDRSIVVSGQNILVPGVASSLQAVLGRSGSAPPVQAVISNTIPGLKGQGLNKKTEDEKNSKPQHESQLPRRSADEPGGYIIANERLNAVIVHDRKSKMPLYQKLIDSLDQARRQIEIEVSIIDVSTDRLNEVGVEWQVGGKNAGVTNADFSNGALPQNTNELAIALGDGIGFSTLQSNAQNLFLSRIRVLAEQGDASVLSQPTILTLDNIEAVLDHSTTFYVRLVGDSEVDLFPVSVGSVVRVTPHIVSNNDTAQVHLNINIQDGQQTGDSVDDIPTISKSVINTEALVNENSSLLVGGYYFNQDSTAVRKVPLLGDLPILGQLFRKDSTQVQQRARLFLISPRIVGNSTSETEYSDRLGALTGHPALTGYPK